MKVKAQSKPDFVVGIDEVGRGPLAGPVAVTAVLMTRASYRNFCHLARQMKLRDSKALTEKQRDEWAQMARKWQRTGLLDFAYASVRARTIDRIGIVRAIRRAIRRTLKSLDLDKISEKADVEILLDGLLSAPAKFKNQKTIIRGDSTQPIISLASIVAKVRRDAYMKKISMTPKTAHRYAKYDFASNKGYGSAKHLRAIRKYGLSDQHRRTYCKNI